MGKIISKNKREENEDEQEIRKYEQQTTDNPYGFGLQDTDDLKIISWWQRLLFDLRFRITYALIIAIILGVAVPVLVHFVFYDNSDSTIYGSCLIKDNARFECLINNGKPATRKECVQANCCWEENNELPFKCFHSFPSAYQYTVGEIRELPPDDDLLPGDGIQLSVHPNHEEWMSRLTVWIKWLKSDHLNLQIFNPNHYPERMQSGGGGVGTRSMEKNGIIVNYADENDYFFIQIIRKGPTGNITIFDTRLGPIFSPLEGDFTFSTTLSTPYFFGLTGGEGISSKGTLTLAVLNGFENAQLPFYMALEESSSWHGMLLETTLPFMTQILQAPGIGFHIEGPKADVNLHFFLGPTQNETLTQLHLYLSEKIVKSNDTGLPQKPLPYIPPYWGLGLHLCRKTSNASQAWSHIQELNEITNPNTGERRIPYDSDCIDQDLRNPFGIDYENFPDLELQTIIDFLKNETLGKKIVLSQKMSIPFNNETDISEIQEFLVMDKTNLSDIHPFLGLIDNHHQTYLDVFHPNIFKNLDIWNFTFGNISLSSLDGLILVDSFPRNEEPMNSSSCKKPDSFLQKLLFATSPDTNLDSDSINGDGITRPFGSICPEMLHTLEVAPNGESAQEKTHLELHNLYGFQALKKFRQVLISLAAEEDEEDGNLNHLLLSTSSAWSESRYFGVGQGMESNFTWVGLRESLSQILRQFILSPLTGISVCGSFLPNEYPVMDNNLCLRSYQLALLLPYVYHNYAYLNDSRGPLVFPRRYQGYLREAIRQRYTYSPYYYTLLVNYQKGFQPMILPMSYHFHDVNGVDQSTIFKLLDQFMIGEAILAAPIIKQELNRETYFPPGLWFDSDGLLAWNDTQKGGFKYITGYLVQTPLFLRGGYVIPTLQNPIGNSIMESRAGNYTLLVTLIPNLESRGVLYADNGMNGSSPIISEIRFEFQNQFEITEIRINAKISVIEATMFCESTRNTTKIIDQIKILGFPHRFSNITAIYEEHSEIQLEAVPGDELDYLRIGDIAMNFCVDDTATINIIAGIDPST